MIGYFIFFFLTTKKSIEFRPRQLLYKIDHAIFFFSLEIYFYLYVLASLPLPHLLLSKLGLELLHVGKIEELRQIYGADVGSPPPAPTHPAPQAHRR